MVMAAVTAMLVRLPLLTVSSLPSKSSVSWPRDTGVAEVSSKSGRAGLLGPLGRHRIEKINYYYY